MGRKLRCIGWITSLFLGGALLGCTKSALQQKPVSDPLLVTKPAVEGRKHTAQASPLHRMEPPPPPTAPADVDSPTSVRRDLRMPVRPAVWPVPMPE
jgi:hypothetical protein